jgi:hypothetical protein
MCSAVLLQISHHRVVTGLVRSRVLRGGLSSGTDDSVDWPILGALKALARQPSRSTHE